MLKLIILFCFGHRTCGLTPTPSHPPRTHSKYRLPTNRYSHEERLIGQSLMFGVQPKSAYTVYCCGEGMLFLLRHHWANILAPGSFSLLTTTQRLLVLILVLMYSFDHIVLICLVIFVSRNFILLLCTACVCLHCVSSAEINVFLFSYLQLLSPRLIFHT